MQKVEVDVIQTELAQAYLVGAKRFFVAVVADPQVGDEKLGARDPGAPDAFADLSLNAIGRGGVDEPITRGYGRFNSSGYSFRGSAIQRAEPGGRHFDAVVQSEEDLPSPEHTPLKPVSTCRGSSRSVVGRISLRTISCACELDRYFRRNSSLTRAIAAASSAGIA